MLTLNILQINASMKGKEGFSEAELFQLLLGVLCNACQQFWLGSWFLHDASFAVLLRSLL